MRFLPQASPICVGFSLLLAGKSLATLSPVRARPLRDRSLCSPSQRNPGSATPPYAASPANLCPPSFPAQIRESVGPLRSICAAPSCATGLRPHLTPTPSASRSGRGVADESLRRLRTASHPHEPRQQVVVTPRVAAAHPKFGSRCSASKGQSGSLRAGCFDKVLLAAARPRSARCLEGGENVRAFLPTPETPHRPANAGKGRCQCIRPAGMAAEFERSAFEFSLVSKRGESRHLQALTASGITGGVF